MIGAGKLREHIDIERIQRVDRPDGGWDEVPVIIHSTFAQIKELSPSIDVISQQQNINIVIQVTIRYNPEVNIEVGDTITWRGFRFVAMKPRVDYLRRHIIFMCNSEIEETYRGPDAT